MNPQNLIPLTMRTEEEARRIRSMGGKVCAKKKRERALLRDAAREILAMPIGEGTPERLETLEAAGNASLSVMGAILIQAAREATDPTVPGPERARAREWLFSLAEGASGKRAFEDMDELTGNYIEE